MTARLAALLPMGASRRIPRSVLLVAAACGIWTAVVLAGVAERGLAWQTVLVGGVAAAVIAAFLWRGPLPSWLVLALAWTAIVAAAVAGAEAVRAQPAVAAVPVILTVAAIAATRWPVVSFAVAFGLAGAWSSIELYTGLPVSYICDLLLGGLWASLVWQWATGRREPPQWLAAGLVLTGVYLILVALSAATVEPLERGVFAYRLMFWYIAATILVPLVITGERHRDMALKAVLLVASIAAAYAMFRYAFGAGAREEEQARRIGRGYVATAEGELRLLGALQYPQVFGAWCATVAPFALAAALAPIRARWRALAAALVAMAAIGLAASDTRVAMAGIAAGTVAVLALFAVARGAAGRRGPALIAATLLIVVGGGVLVTSRLEADDSTRARFEGLLNPTEDLSFQGRQLKWASILSEVEGRPLGFGVGASGQTEQRYGRYESSVTSVPDGTYIKLLYDQGLPGMILFGCVLVALLAGLVTRVVRSPSLMTSVLATGAAGTLVSWAVVMSAAEYAEGLQALVQWSLIGLGFTMAEGE